MNRRDIMNLIGFKHEKGDCRKRAALSGLRLAALLIFILTGGCATSTGTGESLENNPVSLLRVPLEQEDCDAAYEMALKEGDDSCVWDRALNLWKSRCRSEFNEDDCNALAVKIEEKMTEEYSKFETTKPEKAQELGPVKVCVGICSYFRVYFGNGTMAMSEGDE
jgi:hypothetical protein